MQDLNNELSNLYQMYLLNMTNFLALRMYMLKIYQLRHIQYDLRYMMIQKMQVHHHCLHMI